MVKPLFLALFVVGALAGPGYWAWSNLFTGKLVQTLTLESDGAGGYASPGFPLAPEMRPVGLVLLAFGDFKPHQQEHRPPADRWQVLLEGDEGLRLSESFLLSSPSVMLSEPVFRQRVLQLDPPAAADYRVSIRPEGAPEIGLSQVRVEVREKVADLDVRVFYAGLALLLVGVVGLIFAP